MGLSHILPQSCSIPLIRDPGSCWYGKGVSLSLIKHLVDIKVTYKAKRSELYLNNTYFGNFKPPKYQKFQIMQQTALDFISDNSAFISIQRIPGVILQVKLILGLQPALYLANEQEACKFFVAA